VLEQLELGRERLRGDDAPLRGTLQIAAPSDLGRNILLPMLTEFRRQHPELSLRFLVSDQVTNLFRDPVDVALRYGWNEDANYIALPLAPWNRRVLVASPDYVARHGTPTSVDDLSRHPCLLYLQNGRLHDRWELGEQTVQVTGPLFSDDADVVRRWAVAGEGIAYKTWLDVYADVQAQRLVVLLPEIPGDVYPLSFACPHRGQMSRAVTQLYQWLNQQFSALQRL
jgi:DNA-binding transcriptional LysR family regulator